MALSLLVPCHTLFTLRYTWYRVVGQLPPTPFPPGLHVTVADVPVAATSTLIYAAVLGLMLGVGVAVGLPVGVAVGVWGKVVDGVAVKCRFAGNTENPVQELPRA